MFRHFSRSQQAVLLSILILGSVLSLSELVVNGKKSRDHDARRAEALSDVVRERIQNRLDATLKVLPLVRAEWVKSHGLKRNEFSKVVAPYLQVVESLKAVEWIPRVPHSARRKLEQQATREGYRDFSFKERDQTTGRNRIAGERAHYAPVYYIEPYVGNEGALGYDLESESVRRNAVEHACESGRMTASAVVELVQIKENRAGILVLEPIHRVAGSTGCQNILGFILGVYQVTDLLQGSLHPLPDGVRVSTFDDGMPIEASPSDGTKAVKVCERAVNLPGRRWTIRTYFSDRYFTQTLAPSVMLAGAGLLMTVIVVFFLTHYMAATQRGERLVEERTRQVITEAVSRQSLEREVERQREAAEAASKFASLGQLVAGVGHEINNPLAVVLANAEILKSAVEKESMNQRALSRIISSATRIGKIVGSLRTFSRTRPDELEDFDAPQVAEDTVSMIEALYAKDGIKVSFKDGSPAGIVRGNGGRFQQVVLNLLSNARDAVEGHQNGEIRIEAEVSDGNVAVRVSDNGAGIAPDVTSRLFETFFTTKAVGKGTGMGLSICRSIMRDLGGEISFESTEGMGSTFTLCLPEVPENAARIPEPANVLPLPPEKGRGRALVVDDDQDLIDVLVHYTTALGLKVAQAKSATVALRLLEEDVFDYILTDNQMPGMSGIDMVKILLEDPRHHATRVVVVTGVTDLPEVEWLTTTGKGRIVSKSLFKSGTSGGPLWLVLA